MPWTSIGVTVQQVAARGRVHLKVGNRFVTVLQHRGELYCIDSACHHASGPLGEGSVSDIEGIPCIKCPWHNFIFALDTGERVQQELLVPEGLPQGTFTPMSQMQSPLQGWPPECLGPAKRTGTKAQRVHSVRVSGADGNIEVDVPDIAPADRFLSDGPSTDPKRGRMCLSIVEHQQQAPAQGNDVGALPLETAAAILFATPRSQLAKPNPPDSGDRDSPAPPDPRAQTPPPQP